MIYNNLLLNQNIFDQLMNYFKSDKIQNAYIFHGENGIGKEAHAIEFFAAINCKNPLENYSGCGTCNCCIKIKSLQINRFCYYKYKEHVKEPCLYRRSLCFTKQKVLDAYGNLKKIVSTQELHTRHWRIFQQLEERKVFLPKTTFPKKVREKKTKAYWRLT